MSVYDKNGNELNTVYGLSGTALADAYDIDGNSIMSGGGGGTHVDRNKTYDYYLDPDPDKSYVWEYSLPEIKALQNGRFTIGVQTDTHYNSEGMTFATPLKNMTKPLYFDFICNLGDVPRGYASDTVEITESAIETMLGRYIPYGEAPVLIANGNHDNANMASGYISKADMHTFYIGGNTTLTGIVNPTGELYYYKDFAECRVIVLDSENYPYLAKSASDININHHVFSAEQVSWFSNIALNTDKPVIVMSHGPLVTDIYPDVLVVPTEDIAANNSIPYRADEIVDVLEAFAGNGGTVVACLCGHIHEQLSVKINGINYISFDNGGTLAELVFIDFNNRQIQTTVINSDLANRAFAF